MITLTLLDSTNDLKMQANDNGFNTFVLTDRKRTTQQLVLGRLLQPAGVKKIEPALVIDWYTLLDNYETVKGVMGTKITALIQAVPDVKAVDLSKAVYGQDDQTEAFGLHNICYVIDNDVYSVDI